MAPAIELPPPLQTMRYRSLAYQDIAVFLRQHPWLEPLLPEIDHALLGAFPEDTGIHLAVTSDPDDMAGDYLVYGIVSRQPLTSARACLAAFDEAWLLDNLERLQDKVLFRLRFV